MKVYWDLYIGSSGRGCAPLPQTGRDLLKWNKETETTCMPEVRGTETTCVPKRVHDL